MNIDEIMETDNLVQHLVSAKPCNLFFVIKLIFCGTFYESGTSFHTISVTQKEFNSL